MIHDFTFKASYTKPKYIQRKPNDIQTETTRFNFPTYTNDHHHHFNSQPFKSFKKATTKKQQQQHLNNNDIIVAERSRCHARHISVSCNGCVIQNDSL